jgi:ubiquinol-cytochrome c reductase cytochrome c subunit
MAKGGVVPGAVAPSLQQATPTQIAEAVRVGPNLMPAFTERDIDQRQLDSITRFVLSTRNPPDRGGWGIGNLGPIPEGMIAWLLAGSLLLIILRLLGERTEP